MNRQEKLQLAQQIIARQPRSAIDCHDEDPTAFAKTTAYLNRLPPPDPFEFDPTLVPVTSTGTPEDPHI